MLEIVEYQQQFLIADRCLDPIERGSGAIVRDAKSVRDGGRHQRWTDERNERDDRYTALERGREGSRDFERQLRFADTAWADEGEQPNSVAFQEIAGCHDRLVTADQ